MPRPAKRVELSSPPELNISSDKVAFIIEKAREFDVKEGLSDPNSGSNPIDDRDADVLEDKPGDATRQELFDAIRALNEDERNALIALAWLAVAPIRSASGRKRWTPPMQNTANGPRRI